MTHTPRRSARDEAREPAGIETLRKSPTMARLLDAMEAGTDIGHYGQFTFVTVARHFLEDEPIVKLLARQPDMDAGKAHALLLHVREREYNPPRRERILEQQARGGFPIITDPGNLELGNLYRELSFPDAVYEEINDYYEEKADLRDRTEKR